LLQPEAIHKKPRGIASVFGGNTMDKYAAFTAGYLLVWTAFSLLATGSQWMFPERLLRSPMMEAQERGFGSI
jgi:predicted metal-binding membrane protein